MRFILFLAVCFVLTETIVTGDTFPEYLYEAAVDNVEAVWSIISSIFVQVGGDLGGPCEGVLNGWKRTPSAPLEGENFCVNLEGSVVDCVEACRLQDPLWVSIGREYI